MSDPKEPITLRLDPAMLARLDRLADRLASNPTAAALGRVTRQAAARLALLRGLDVLEAEAAPPPPAPTAPALRDAPPPPDPDDEPRVVGTVAGHNAKVGGRPSGAAVGRPGTVAKGGRGPKTEG